MRPFLVVAPQPLVRELLTVVTEERGLIDAPGSKLVGANAKYPHRPVYPPSSRLSARIDRVVVTGASSGIGLDIARRFLAEGSRLVLTARDPGKLARAHRALEAGERAVTVPGHVGDPATARAVAAAARRHLDGVDVLVNNAGIFGVKPFLESTLDDLERYFETNVKGTWLMTQALVPLMIAAGGGAIINVGTVLVQQGRRLLAWSLSVAAGTSFWSAST